jgi:hypothetical protein
MNIFPMTPLIIALKIRKIIKKFKDSQTTTPQTAKSLDEINIKRRFIFNRLLKNKVIIEVNFDRYYLNEANIKDYNKRRRRKVIIAISLLLLIFLTLWVLIENHFI